MWSFCSVCVCVCVCVSACMCASVGVFVFDCACACVCPFSYQPRASSSPENEFRTHFISFSQHQFRPSTELALSTCLLFSCTSHAGTHQVMHSYTFSFKCFQSPQPVTMMNGVHKTLLHYWLISVPGLPLYNLPHTFLPRPTFPGYH